MSLNIQEAEQALKETETMDGLIIEGNNRKVTQLLSLHQHLKNALEEIEELHTELRCMGEFEE